MKKKAAIFITQLELLRRKFKANLCTISISTHYRDTKQIEQVLNILSESLLKTIEIGTCFYYGGTYNYKTKKEEPKEPRFNANKVETFDSYYINNPFTNNIWSAIIDDNLNEDTYKKYKNTHPVLIARPSKSKKEKDNFMSLSTTTKGFDGVIEMLDTYIESIKGQNIAQIMNKQKNIIAHLSSYELTNIIINRDYQFLEKYFSNLCADDDDYDNTLLWLSIITEKTPPTPNEIKSLDKTLDILSQKFENENKQDNIEKVKTIKKTYINN